MMSRIRAGFVVFLILLAFALAAAGLSWYWRLNSQSRPDTSSHNARTARSIAPPPKAVDESLSRRQCALFSKGVQELNADSRRLAIHSYSPILLQCQRLEHRGLSGSTRKMIAIRQMVIDREKFLFLADPQTLSTFIEREDCYSCEDITAEAFEQTRFGAAVARLALRTASGRKNETYLAGAGLRRGENDRQGVILSADLCPTPKTKPIFKSFFERIANLQPNAPLAVAISGRWLKTHQNDFVWLKKQVEFGKIAITWVNHSYRHSVSSNDLEHNYLLSPGTDIQEEVLRNEKTMIENGITPSVFFRFPGLISDKKLMRYLRSLFLIPLAADAWLALGQTPENDSIILIHANGNEPAGLQRLKGLIESKTIPLPLLPLQTAPSELAGVRQK